MTLIECIEYSARQLEQAGVAFGHGTTNAFDEAVWLILWQLGLPLASDLNAPNIAGQQITNAEQEKCQTLIDTRIRTRKPAAYLTQEAWLQGVPFFIDERSIVPRSLIAELLVEGGLDHWLHANTRHVLDLCTGNGSLAVIAALTYPDTVVVASDVSAQALEVAHINVERHGLQNRISVLQANGLDLLALKPHGPFDLIICNPPYVNAESMRLLPPEYKAEPALALDGNTAGSTDGMDFIRALLMDAAAALAAEGILVLEIGHERDYFEAAFPMLEAIWLQTSAGEDQVVLLTKSALEESKGKLRDHA